MRVIFAVWSWSSHYYPLVPLAWAMRAAGHEVVIAGQPALMPEIARSGHLGVACGDDVDLGARFLSDVSTRLGPPGPAWKTMAENDREAVERRAYGLFVDVARSMTDDLLRFAGRRRPDLIVYDPLTFAGPLVAARLGVPAVRFLFGPVTSPPAWEREALRPLSEHLGLPEMGSRGDWTIDSCPPSMQTPEEAGHQPVRYVPYNGPGLEPAWVHQPRARPRVLVSWGTSTVRLMGEHAFGLPTVVAAAARLDVDVVVAVAPRERSLLPDLPPGAIVAESVPFHLLMTACDAVLHQGGAGTMLTAAGLGLPQILFPLITDQLVNARSLAATGAGSFLIRRGEGEEEFRDLIADRLRSVLENGEWRAAADRLRAEIARQPDPGTVVSLLERRLCDI
ncbi:nucleotide disphospho-sugar-binding domain-containing protein [Nonomuraea fastidiosa]|uniref:nucleotide disphospho-sugar-binding domain-containing protein n=1 Tax=Nonomuraea fastidiosa TaxID=46173 RepID=UPI0036716A34